MATEFNKQCPTCYSSNHSAIASLYGWQLRHCSDCGGKFLWAGGVELRELPPQPAPSVSEQMLEEDNKGILR